MNNQLSRRDFMKVAALTAGGAALAGACSSPASRAATARARPQRQLLGAGAAGGQPAAGGGHGGGRGHHRRRLHRPVDRLAPGSGRARPEDRRAGSAAGGPRRLRPAWRHGADPARPGILRDRPRPGDPQADLRPDRGEHALAATAGGVHRHRRRPAAGRLRPHLFGRGRPALLRGVRRPGAAGRDAAGAMG